MPQESLEKLFNPNSVAVIGASKDTQKLGAIVLKNLVKSEFPGKIYPINPKYETLGDLPCYKNLNDLPESPDLAILVTPASTVLGLLDECSQKEVKNVVIFAAGYKEIGTEGEKLEKELADTAKKLGINILGPNCLGFVNNKTPINATFGEAPKNKGNLRFITQSGAIAASLFDWCEQNDLGFDKFVTLGNKSVINENHVLKYFSSELSNQNTKPGEEGLSTLNPIGLYLESISDGPKFLEITREICKENPIFLLKPGKTPLANRAMSSHTGAIAQEDDILQALTQQAGITRCKTLQEFFDLAKAFSWENLPAGPKVAIVSNAGGPAVISADAVSLEGLELAQLDEDTKKKLSKALPRAASIVNPVDVLGDALADRYAQAINILLEKPEVDSLLVLLTPQIMTQIEKTAWVIGEAGKKHNKPVLCSFMGGESVSYGEGILNKYKIPSFRFPEEAISAIGSMWRYKNKRDELNKTTPSSSKESSQEVRNEIGQSLIERAQKNGQQSLNNLDANALIESGGIPTPRTSLPKTLEEAQKFAEECGFPVVLKLSSPKLLHKREVGGVILDIKDSAALDDAWHKMERKVEQLEPSLRNDVGFQIQKSVPQGVEVIIGVKQDPSFGSVLLFGAGGTFAELIADKNLRLLPINLEEAKKLVQKSKVYKILKGRDENPSYALDKLYDLIVKVGNLAKSLPKVKELEINPVTIDINNVWAVDSKVVLTQDEAKPQGIKFNLAGTLSAQVLASKFHYFEFESENPLSLKPGQYINVKVAPNTIRAYSIATYDNNRNFGLLVDTRPGGPGSQFFENLKAGDVITYMGPFGTFIFDPNDDVENILFLATGSGISAIRCMIEVALIEHKITKPVKLYYGLTHEEEIFWKDYFEELSQKYPNFSYQYCLCDPKESWEGPKGFITQLVEKDFPDASNCSAYMCGHKNMIADSTELLKKLGCSEEKIYKERFA
jgi:acetate---CoA ligase (ADP-forming)